jgi:hypothetical protein
MTLVWASGYNGITDPDAQTYIAAVEAADGQAIEGDVALSINDFVVGCKLDGIWDAIKASCILAGARTLSGALVPLKGAAPTNVGGLFVSGDYNRETGLVGNASTKYLNSNRLRTADPQDNYHLAVHISTLHTLGTVGLYAGSGPTIGTTGFSHLGRLPDGNHYVRGTNSTSTDLGSSSTGFFGLSRASSTVYTARQNASTTTITQTSETRPAESNLIFAGRFLSGAINAPVDSRLSFYSIGESLDLEQLDTRTTRLMNLISYSLASGLPDLSTMDLDAASYIGAVYRAGGTLS